MKADNKEILEKRRRFLAMKLDHRIFLATNRNNEKKRKKKKRKRFLVMKPDHRRILVYIDGCVLCLCFFLWNFVKIPIMLYAWL